jgi:hypothetical protein
MVGICITNSVMAVRWDAREDKSHDEMHSAERSLFEHGYFASLKSQVLARIRTRGAGTTEDAMGIKKETASAGGALMVCPTKAVSVDVTSMMTSSP